MDPRPRHNVNDALIPLVFVDNIIDDWSLIGQQHLIRKCIWVLILFLFFVLLLMSAFVCQVEPKIRQNYNVM